MNDPCPCWSDPKYVTKNAYCEKCQANIADGNVLRVKYPSVFDPFFLPPRAKGAKIP